MERRLHRYRKDIIELIAGRDRAQVFAELRQKNILNNTQLNHFITLDDPLQAYTYLLDAVLTDGHIMAEKFYMYLLDTDVTNHFHNLISPKGMCFTFRHKNLN